MELEPVNLAAFLEITPSAFLYKSRLENAPLVLIVKFKGLYHSGSSGSPDAGFISAVKNSALYHYVPDALILDFSELEYEWGDDLDNLLPDDDAVYYWRRTPMAVVVGPRCREAIRTLTFGLEDERQLSETTWAKDSLEEAISFIEPRAAARKSSE